MTQNDNTTTESVKTPDAIFCAQIEAMGFTFRQYNDGYLNRGYKADRVELPAYYKRELNYDLLQLIEKLLWKFQDNSADFEARELSAFYRYKRSTMFYTYQPNISLKDPALMSIYESKVKLDKITDDGLGIQTIGKPAKMIKKIFPFLDESCVTWFAEQWKEKFIPAKLTLINGTQKEHFSIAYSGKQTNCLNPYYGHKAGLYSKSLSGSCMRYDFGFNEGHPAITYASGDFESIYAVDESGKIAGRVVVNIKQGDKQVFLPGPVYVNSNHAFDFIMKYLVERGFNGRETRDSGWHGAKLLAIPCSRERGAYIMPYIDLECSLELDGEYWLIGDNGTRPRTTQGFIFKQECEGLCVCCDQELFEGDDYHTLNNGDTYCESCADSELVWCSGTDQHISATDSVTVYTIARSWVGNRLYRDSTTYSESYVQDNCSYSEAENEWFNSESVTYSEDLGDYIPNDLIGIGKDYMVSDESGELFESSDMVELPNGNWIHYTEVDDSEFVLSGNTGSYSVTPIIANDDSETTEESVIAAWLRL